MTEIRLFPISLNLLYDGMVATYDIFDYTATQFLLRKGRTVTANNIESIRSINGGHETIYVSEEMYNMIIMHSMKEKVKVQEKLEEETGYTEVKNETLAFLQEMEDKRETVPQEMLVAVSDKLSEHLDVTSPDIIVGLINALAPVDEYLQRHCVNVSLLNGLMGKWLHLPKETIDTLVLIGLLHDCGKASLPRQIIRAPRGLTIMEYEVVKTHSVHSYNLLDDFPETVRYGVRSHHEKYDGSGYPDGASRFEIPFFGRITAVSDIYDAMTSRRSYKKPYSPFYAMSLIKKTANAELDPMLVDVFLENMPSELIDKPVKLSNKEIGIITEIDPSDLQHPRVKIGNKVIKCDEELYCVSMYLE